MLPERRFLDAIQSNPDDDVAKLVFADWLDEQGDERGELIRLLVEVRDTASTHNKWSLFQDAVSTQFGVSEFSRCSIQINVGYLHVNVRSGCFQSMEQSFLETKSPIVQFKLPGVLHFVGRMSEN